MVTLKSCECGQMTEEECQCAFYDGEPWLEDNPDVEDFDPEWGDAPSNTENVSPPSE